MPNTISFPAKTSAKEECEQVAEFPIVASGAVGTATRLHGVSSMTNTGTGTYTINLVDPCYAITAVQITIEDSTYAATDGHLVFPVSRTAGATPSVNILCCQTGDGTAANPRNGAVMIVRITTKKAAG